MLKMIISTCGIEATVVRGGESRFRRREPQLSAVKKGGDEAGERVQRRSCQATRTARLRRRAACASW